MSSIPLQFFQAPTLLQFLCICLPVAIIFKNVIFFLIVCEGIFCLVLLSDAAS